MALFKKKQIPPEEIKLDEIDRESKYKIFSPRGEMVIKVILTCWALFQLYASISNKVPLQILRYTHLGMAISMAYILYPATKHADRHKLPWYDVMLAGLFLCVAGYFIVNYKPLQFRAGMYNLTDTVMAGIGIALVLLACWRVVGPPIVIIASCFFLYGMLGKYMGGFLLHRGFSLKRIITHLFITTEGVIGNPLGVCSTYIFLFILFGAFLEKTGIGQFFIDLANALAGWAAGGPAKVAVLSSALQGTVSGSSVSNTVSTGSFTIPMMKSLGYEPEFAGAVEAAASTGGQIMPPVMGSAAFLISETCNVPYRQLMIIALIPVEEVHDALLGEPGKNPDMIDGEGGTQGGHAVGDPCLMGQDHVGVAFHDDGHTTGHDGVLGLVETEELPVLLEDRGLLGVQVLGLPLADDPPAEGDAVSLHVVDGEHDAVVEPVVDLAIADDGHVRIHHLLTLEPEGREMPNQGSPAGSEAQVPVVRHLAAQLPAGQIGTCRVGLGGTEPFQLHVIELGRGPADFLQLRRIA